MNDDTDLVWEGHEFQQLLAGLHPGPAFALIRRAHGLSQADFGVLLHWERSHTGRVEREEVATLFDLREMTRVADVLGVPRRALLPVLLGTTEIGTIEGTEGKGVEDVDRRQFGLTVFGSALAAAAFPPAASAAGSPMTIGADHISYFNQVTDAFFEHDSLHGSGGLVESALKQCSLARELLERASYDQQTGVELARATGNLVDCAGWLAFDSGNQRIARDCFTEALILAERSGDAYLWSNVMDDLRNQAWKIGNMREGLQLSLRISDAIRPVRSTRLHALHAAREAVAHAAVGDRRAAEAAMIRALREVDRGLDDPDDPIWLHFVTPAEIQSITAQARTYLGQHDQAADIYQASVGAQSKPRDEASYRAYHSSSLARLGDHNAAVTEGLSALALLEGPVKSRRLVAELEPVRTAVDGTRSSEAELFRARFDQLMTASSGRDT
ncbi:transcriptional regulator with XRE-family HTH domain [Nocardia transvalensis]|uniref:Transcriptional regulator with XRE-family HTH domain n=1 Tax=Nocardia transvalensis TaxID=37333 RepID=A0A7W9PIK6_9NOCA|nr:helix-turn-helix domain-containing protein [Nocardia transvalensis]MBB5916826.1 transcriptional regulator with XRE-family HTH domain [Nocardia transvalensis]